MVAVQRDTHVDYVKDYWVPATGPKVLSNKFIIKILQELNPCSLDLETMQELENLCESDEFDLA